MKKQYNLAALGGTFDHFHKGHQTLIKYAFSVSKKVIIGITDKELIQNKAYADQIQSYLIRKNKVIDFLKKKHFYKNAQIIELKNIYGPTLKNQQIQALIVSPLTKTGANLINQIRENNGLKQLDIKICKLEKADDGNHISSTRIRKGEIDTYGFVYKNLLTKTVVISPKQRLKLKKPLGKLYKNDQKHQLIPVLKRSVNIAIGDATCSFCHNEKIPVRSFIFDQYEQRKKLENSIRSHLISTDVIETENKKGSIAKNIYSTIIKAYQKHQHLQIIGEEDLLVIPAILALPLGTIIIYGQPNQGLVLVKISIKAKNNIKGIITR